MKTDHSILNTRREGPGDTTKITLKVKYDEGSKQLIVDENYLDTHCDCRPGNI